ncbi:MAG TPA: EamA family transporter [Tepidisphaeraceae bacterium]|nr:EamA family transporter [Tepidisphaeraceae bacterium]
MLLTWFLNPYLQIAIGALCDTAGELLLKRGANASHSTSGFLAVVGLTPMASIWTWLGIISYVSSLVSWLHVLRFVPVSIAFPLINAVHILVPVGSWIFLHEAISMRRWIGIGMIVCGILAMIKPLMRAEEKL